MRFIILLLFLCCAWPCASHADSDTSKNAQVISNLLKYIHGVSLNDIGIVYDPALAASQHEAEMLAQSIGGGDQHKLSLVSIDNLLHNTQVKFIVVTNGLMPHFSSIANYARSQHIFTLSLDTRCTQQNCCILSVDTTSGIEIFLNEVLLRDLGFDVDAALRFMVKRV